MNSVKTLDLAGIGYWDRNWASQHPPIIIDYNFIYHPYLLDKFFKKYLSFNGEYKFLKIGCGCGAWLVYFNRVFGYKVYGVDYSNKACELSRNNLRTNKAEGAILKEGIFMAGLKKESFDVVFSSGFVEHFNDPAQAI